MRILLSFDIDGTLETGDPPGPVTLEMVRRARDLGCIIGSSSDRSISSQKTMWEKNDIEVDFVSNKHVLIEIKHKFEADYYLHMGDRELDRQFAREAEFDFMWMDEAAGEPWIAMKNGSAAQTLEGSASSAPGSFEEIEPKEFTTADCKPSSHDQHWCSTHHKPVWECKTYEEGLYSPQREFNGLT